MGLKNLLPWAKKSADTLPYEQIYEMLLGQAATRSGISLNWQTALQYSVTQACVRVIAEDIAQLPCAVYRYSNKNGSQPATEHPLYHLIKTKPNDIQTAFEFRETLALHLLMKNNAYVYLNKIRGDIAELLLIDPHHVEPRLENGEKVFKVTTKSGTETYTKDEIWHIKGLSWNSYQGLDGIRLMREAIGLAVALEGHAARMFKNGATVGGLLSTETNLTPEQRKDMRESWEKRHTGMDNAYKTAVMWGGMKWTPIGMPNTDAQHLENRRFQVEETCRNFKVLPIMVGHSGDKGTTYASAEQMVLIHLRQTLGPWLTRLEQSSDCFLLSKDDLKAGYYTKFTRNGLLAMTAQARAEFYTKLYNIGAINPNEIRDLEDMNPYEGGDQYRVPLNMVDPTTEQAQANGTGT